MSKNMPTRGGFRFRKTDRIGAAGAEEDLELLKSCFVDTGYLQLLEDHNDNRQIVLGRTGSGKTALLAMLKERYREHVIDVVPESLALTYVTNSTVLNFFASIGVNLDPFFKLLWRHVFTVELLRRHLGMYGGARHESVMDKLKSLFPGSSRRDKQMQDAIEYLEEWGQSFWEETEFRVKEITSKVETDLNGALKARLGFDIANIEAGLSADNRIAEEHKAELIARGQDIVSRAQVRDLHHVLELLDAVLDDKQKRYYITIDKLDENWVEERLRYKLIMALFVTARDFIKVKNAKIITAVRRDLVERVFRLARESGFQEEKYQSLYVPIVWNSEDILEVLDRRVTALVAPRYTKREVVHQDLLPRRYNNQGIDEYISAVAPRPRDVIAFFNNCIESAPSLSKLTAKELKSAEGEYSRGRLRALGDEWSGDYPALLDFAAILQRRPASFKASNIDDNDIADMALRVTVESPDGRGVLQEYARRVVDCVLAPCDFKMFLLKIFYHVGLVGLKTKTYEGESWVDELGRSISAAEISDSTSIVVHPAYRRALGVLNVD